MGRKTTGIYGTMRTRFLNWLEKHGRCRVIYDRGSDEPYLIRYYLLFKNRPRWFPFNITLHKIVKSDIPILHDHPWGYASIILKGGYIEHVPDDRFCRVPGHIRFRRAKSFHWLELVNENEPCWTLFFMGKKHRQWGFLTDNGWIDNETFLAER